MAKQNNKKIGKAHPPKRTWQENWEVMKPFVHFSIKALGIVAGAVVGIIRLLPILLEHKENQPAKKDTKIIKI
jgi:hypothetical protein